MQILGNLFNIILFVCVVGNVFTIALLFLQKALRFALPLWVGIVGTAFYLVPIVVPQVELISPGETLWIRAYEIASIIWIIGTAIFLCYYLLRTLFAARAFKTYSACEDKRISQIYAHCSGRLSMENPPSLLFGTLKEPACVVTVFRPVVILNKDIALQLSNTELKVVLCHELMHIKRHHHLGERVYDMVSMLYWFNPLVWIAKSEFSYTCELDCDSKALKALAPEASVKDYSAAMFHLIELSSEVGRVNFNKMGALRFLMVRQRLVNILHRPSKKRKVAMLLFVMICIAFTIMLSTAFSKAMFYPYLAYSNGAHEYAEKIGP